jgi:glycosyltransferase involved in cell wall biosynthesis
MIRQRILLMLRTPPPFGGGEIRAAALGDYVCHAPDFIPHVMSHRGRSKENQGGFALWKVLEFARHWWGLVMCCIWWRPALVYFSLPKRFPHFVRDSVFFWTAWMLGARVAGELAGARFQFLHGGAVQRWYGRLVLSRFACIRLLGAGLATELRRLGIHRTIVTDNGVPAPQTDHATASRDSGCFRFLFVGTHSVEKGFADLVAAAVQLAAAGVPFEVHCVGDWISDRFRAEIVRQLRSARAEGRFVFHGDVRGAAKDRLFAAAQVLVLASHSEGQPLVVLEALAFGLPIIASRVGAIPETLTDQANGLLIEPRDAPGLTLAMRRLVEEAETRETMAAKNRELYARRYTQEKFLQTQTAWLRECAAGTLHPQGQRFELGSGDSPATAKAEEADRPPRILAVLRPPPPFGGGEIIGQYLLNKYSTRDGFTVYAMGSKRRTKSNQDVFALWKLGEFLGLTTKLVWRLVRKRPDLLFWGSLGKAFPHFFRDSLILWPALLRNIPVVTAIHGEAPAFLRHRGLRAWYGRLVLNRLKSFRVLGASIEKECRRCGVRQATVLENGVEGPPDGNVVRNVARDGDCVLLFAGTLSPKKGFDVLVEAARVLKQRGATFRVECLGVWISKTFRASMLSQILDAGMESQFVFHGLRLGESKWEVIGNADILVLPSLSEGQPLVILEAYASGLAVIASAVGAIPDTVADNVNGRLIPPSDPAALAEAVGRLAREPETLRRIKQNNKTLFLERYTLTHFLERHERWLRECCTAA